MCIHVYTYNVIPPQNFCSITTNKQNQKILKTLSIKYRYIGIQKHLCKYHSTKSETEQAHNSVFQGEDQTKIGWTSWLETLFFNGKGKKEAPFFPLKGGGVSFSPLLICACWIQVQIQVNGLHFPEIYTLRPYAAQSVSEQHSHAISGLLVPWKNVPSNLCWFRCSELHVPETVCQAVTLPSEKGFVGLSGLSLGRCLLQGLLHRKCSLYLLKGKCAFIFYSNPEKLLFFLSNYFWSDLGI